MKTPYPKAVIFVAAANLFFLSNPFAFAQTLPNVLGDPHYGSIEFGNSSSSRTSQEISAGGSFDLSEMNPNYDGYISSIPDLQITYSGGNGKLSFKVESKIQEMTRLSWYFYRQDNFYSTMILKKTDMTQK